MMGGSVHAGKDKDVGKRKVQRKIFQELPRYLKLKKEEQEVLLSYFLYSFFLI